MQRQCFLATLCTPRSSKCDGNDRLLCRTRPCSSQVEPMARNSRGSRMAENCVVGRIQVRRFISQHLSRPIYASHALQSLQRDPTVALEKHQAINARGAVAGCPRALCGFPFRCSVGSSTFSKRILHVDQAFHWECSVSRRVRHRPTSTPNATNFAIGCTLKLKPWIRQGTKRRKLC